MRRLAGQRQLQILKAVTLITTGETVSESEVLVLGTREPGSISRWIVIECRRYRCVRCGAVLIVVPRGVAPRRHYGRAAIAMALTLWAIAREPVAAVRQRICARPVTAEAMTRWPTLPSIAAAGTPVVGRAIDRIDTV